MNPPFNVKKHSDITVTVIGEAGDERLVSLSLRGLPSITAHLLCFWYVVPDTYMLHHPDRRTFHLHKFPLISKSHYFDEHIPDTASNPDFKDLVITDFPGGPAAFEVVAKYCYGIDIELTVENLAHVYCAARALRVVEMEKSTEQFLSAVVLQDPSKAAVVLKVATTIPGARAHTMQCH
jgi:hypothetical protein